MTTNWVSLGIEGLVAILLAVTIGYCIVLNGRLKKLKADEMGLRKTITELVLATEIAERAINGLKQAATDCDKTLAKRVREAEFFSIEIGREIGEGAAILERIAQITKAATARTDNAQRSVAAAGKPVEGVTGAVKTEANRADELRIKAIESSERLANLRRGAAAEQAA